ncbi:MAG TPA: ATP-binding protein [Desulfotomaculum sp.]|nr:ATP-binding protein [Desulfotomaculum sp.]
MVFLEQEQVIKVLLGFNPWWASGNVPGDLNKPIKRVAFYEIKRILLHHHLRRIVFLSGARRVGKTTLIYQIIGDLLSSGVPARRILYLSFDHPLLKFFNIGQVIEFFQNNVASKEDKELYLFLDEIQYAGDWDSWLKVLYDQNPSFRIMVTGSATPLLSTRGMESGVGRWVTIKVPTLSFYEYIELIGAPEKPDLKTGIKPTRLHYLDKNELNSIMISLSGLQKYFHRYLLIGGFPELALSDDTMYARRILREDVADKVLKRDVTALFGTRNVIDLEKIFLYLCLHSGNIIVQDVIAREIQVSRQTVAHYLGLLEQANLIYVSNPIELAGKKVLRSKPKIYIADAALRNAVLILDESVLTDPNEMGIIMETSVYKHVVSFYYTVLPRIGYYRDKKNNKEIDIVVALPRGRILVEVKYREDPGVKKGDAIVELADQPDTLGAVLVTKNMEDFGVLPFKTRTPIVKIPAFAFLYLLGHAEREARAGETFPI